MHGEPAEGEPEAALGSPEVGRLLHTIDTDLVRLQQLGPAISDEWRAAVGTCTAEGPTEGPTEGTAEGTYNYTPSTC